MILVLVITDEGVYGVYVKKRKIVGSFSPKPMENLKKIMGKIDHAPLVICWSLSGLYLLKKNSTSIEPQILKAGHGQALYTTDPQQIKSWVMTLRNLKNPIKAMALLQKTSDGMSIQIPIYAKALQFKSLSYWMRRLLSYSGWMFGVMALVNLGFSRLQYAALQKEIDQSMPHLEHLEKSYQIRSQKNHWTAEFCQVIESLERKMHGDV